MAHSGASDVPCFSTKPALLPIRNQEDPQQVVNVSLRHLVETRCTSLFTSFKPAWWLPGCHFQLWWAVSGGFMKAGKVYYERQLLRLADGGTLGLDFYPLDYASLADDVPTIVVAHGLSGGSYEPYIRTALIHACAPVDKGGLGYRAVVITSRGCNGVPLTTPHFFMGGYTEDFRQALMYIAHRYPRSTLLGLGFSSGANTITKYLAEEGHNSRLSAVCVLACPWNLAQNSDSLQGSWIRSYIYGRVMGRNVKGLIQIHQKALSLDSSEHPQSQAVSRTLALKNPTLTDFDSAYSRFVGGRGPDFPFPNVNAYYDWASCHNAIKGITVPFLSINAADDPIVKHAPADGGDNPFVVMMMTSRGSHVAWYEGASEKWTTKPILEWLRTFGEDVVDDPTHRGRPLHLDEGGYIKEEGRDDLGCKECEGGDIIDGNVNWLKVFLRTGILAY